VSPLLFLAGALVLFLVFSLGAWLRNRERNVTFESSIERFQSEMGALKPDDDDSPQKRH
jgi:hypothetical protein